MNEFYDSEQLAGITRIDFYLLEEISNFPIVLTDQNSTQIVFWPNQSNVVATVDEDSLVDDTTIKDSTAGSIHEINLKYNIITRSQEIENLLDNYKNKPGIAIVTYHSGDRKLFGTDEEPLLLKYNNKPGSNISDKAFIAVTITGETRNRPVYFNV